MGTYHFLRKAVYFAMLIALLAMSGFVVYADDEGDYILASGFPKSYRTRLAKLHEKHPEWKFKPAVTGLKFEEAAEKMLAVPGINTIWSSSAPSYKSTEKGRYNYLSNTYYGGSFVAASEQAVRYYMDPRNFLNESGIFMFEDKTYSEFHTKAIVRKITKKNSVLYKNAKSFVSAGKKYDISPLYLATKSFSEIGTSTGMMDGHSFKYGGRKYSKCYNAYNIGSSDSRGALGGLIYANGGASRKNNSAGPGRSYGRKWNTPGKAISGGARFLRESFIDKGQATAYTEHFNVMNGVKSVGTHIYMSLVAAPYSMGTSVSTKYKDAGIMNKSLVFEIPVYNKMPAKLCKKPSSSSKKNNNFYLKKLEVKAAKKHKLIKPYSLNYKTSFKITVPDSVSTIDINAVPAAKSGASVSGDGKVDLKNGKNVLKVNCTSSSGITRTYKITVVRS